jgi:myo-inositol-1(or 4)-monophosphatase
MESTNEAAQILDLAERLARAAGDVQRDRYEGDFAVDTKSAAIDLVTEVDQECEALIVGALAEERPDDAILAEEGSGLDLAGARYRWVIDPLDGTVNYAHGYPRFCVSIGIERDGEPYAGVVYDPLLDELYSAVRGGGAHRNGSPLRVSSETRLDRAMLATGFAYDVRTSDADNVDHFGRFVKRARAVRRDGSAALDLCYVASGRLDGYWELKLHPWDVAAGRVILEESGGRFTDLSGRTTPNSGRQVVSSNSHIHSQMLDLLGDPPRD